MSLYLFLAVVLSLASASVAPRDEIPLKQSVVASAALLLAFGLLVQSFAAVAKARIAAGEEPRAIAAGFERRLEWLRWLGLGFALVCLLGFQLAAVVPTWPIASQSLCLQAAILLTPAMVAIGLTLWSESRFTRWLAGPSPAGNDAAVRAGGSLSRCVGWLVAPILALLAVADLVALLTWAGFDPPVVGAIGSPAIGPDSAIAGITVMLSLVVVMPLFVPSIAKRVWATRAWDAQDPSWLRELAGRDRGFRVEMRVWDTGMRHANAVVVGFYPGFRLLLLTDRLIRDLPPDQLRLIVLHEFAHIRRRHIWFRLAAVIPGWGLAMLAVDQLGGSSWLHPVGYGVAIVTTLVLLRWVAHATEYDADRTACQLALLDSAAGPHTANIPSGDDRTSLAGDRRVPAECLVSALRTVCGGTAARWRRSSWLHPSVAARCDAIRSWASEPAVVAASDISASDGVANDTAARWAFPLAPFSITGRTTIIRHPVATSAACEASVSGDDR